MDELKRSCPTEFNACQSAPGCPEALELVLNEPVQDILQSFDANGPGIAELLDLQQCLNKNKGETPEEEEEPPEEEEEPPPARRRGSKPHDLTKRGKKGKASRAGNRLKTRRSGCWGGC